jgi:hypothetical protein
VLACAERPDDSHDVLARRPGVRRTAFRISRERFAARRLAGLEDDTHTGAPRTTSDADVERALTAKGAPHFV